jgi:hypothetical protein
MGYEAGQAGAVIVVSKKEVASAVRTALKEYFPEYSLDGPSLAEYRT